MIDVLVIGGGNAALCAALTAREAGASVLMLERSPQEWRGGNSQHTRNLRYRQQPTFYGFALCFMATSVATIYHYLLGWHAPYGYTSLPKLLGIIGGTSLLFGSGGLLVLGLKRHPLQNSTEQRSMDLGFIILLNLISASGLVLMVSQGTSASTALLCMHLGTVMALFLTLPYGKFSQGFYRSAALLKWSIEKRKPSKLKLGDD